jgi:hypothetical protein
LTTMLNFLSTSKLGCWQPNRDIVKRVAITFNP